MASSKTKCSLCGCTGLIHNEAEYFNQDGASYRFADEFTEYCCCEAGAKLEDDEAHEAWLEAMAEEWERHSAETLRDLNSYPSKVEVA